MSVRIVALCMFRLFALWHGVSFGMFLTMVPFISQLYSLEDAVPWLLEGTLSALLAGVAWIYSSDLARWVESSGRSGLESGVKLGASAYLLLYFRSAVRNVADWIAFGEEGPPVLWAEVGDTHAWTGAAMILIAALLLGFARPLSRLVAREERIRELRRTDGAD